MLEKGISYILKTVSNFEAFINQLVNFVWGIPLVICVVLTASYLLLATKLQPYRYLKHAVGLLFQKKSKNGIGTNSHWEALATALGGTIGMGNIAGVALALQVGGSGAIFWMWITAAIGMILKFFSCTLSCIYRKNLNNTGYAGGPMLTIALGLGENFRWLSYAFALFGMIGCLGIFQSNQLSAIINSKWEVPPVFPSLIIIGLVLMVLKGGVKRLGEISSFLLPIMGGSYLLICVAIIFMNFGKLDEIISSIFLGAFNTKSAIGGVIGLSISLPKV